MRTEHVGDGSKGRLKIPATIFILISLVATLAIAVQAQEGSLSSVVDPDEYIIGPGDRFRVDFWDGTSPTIEVTVTPEGYLLLTGIGRADVGNLILSEARARLRELISKYYPDVEYSITLVGIRSIKVLVSGAVKAPGMYEFIGTQRVSEALEKAGGILEGGSIRNITLNGGVREYLVDLLRYERVGDMNANPYLFSGYRIFVPQIMDSSAFIHISGEVVKAGGFEYRQGDNLGGLLEIAHGVTGQQNDSVLIFRGNQELHLNISAAEFLLKPGDKIVVGRKAVEDEGGYFSITGEVHSPGRYPLKETIGLDAALVRAGGLTPEAAVCSGAIFRKGSIRNDVVFASRLKDEIYYNVPPGSHNLPVAVDLCQYYPENLGKIDIVPGDSVVIPTRTEKVAVLGYVANPGMLTLKEGRVSVRDIIRRAGGYSPGADRGRVEIVRAVSGARSLNGSAAFVYDGDAVVVPLKSQRKGFLDLLKDVALIAGAAGVVYLAIDDMAD